MFPLLFTLSCAHEALPDSAVDSQVELIHPGAGWGFVQALTDGPRWAVLRLFGEEPPVFGQHGEAMGPEPELVLIDLVTGEERLIDDITDISANGAWLLYTDDGAHWLAGPEGLPRLLQADARSDSNACLEPRGAGFAPNDPLLATINADATELVVEDLNSGESWTIPADDRLWRAYVEDGGEVALMLEVSEDGWPYQNTSCACRWCNAFAMSYGFYGWSGPEFTVALVDVDGVRTDPGEPSEGPRPWSSPKQGCTVEGSAPGELLQQGPWRLTCS